jgi:hypothetical protein
MSHAYRKRDGRLEPADERARETLARVKDGDYVLVDVKRLRNPRHHRKMFALLNLIFENQSRYHSIDDMLGAIKVFLGHTRTVRMRDGREFVLPKSIAFDKMDQTEFEVFYARVIDCVISEIIPRLSRKDLERELLEFVE